MYRCDKRFEQNELSIGEKIKLLSQIHNVSEHMVKQEFLKMCYTQMSEYMLWEYVNTNIQRKAGDNNT